jgi:hypothetical protein
MDSEIADFNSGNIAKRNSKFSFLKIVKIEPPNKVKVFFRKRCLRCM